MTPDDDPFGPFGGGDKPGASGGGFLDDLRSSGEQAVDDELAGLQKAMTRVESFAATVAEADAVDVEALRTEWAQIESEIKQALQQGLTAVEERTSLRQQSHLDVEVQSLASEVTRKNELIAQLSDSVKKLNSELDDRDRRLRDEVRALKDRIAQQDDDLAALRARATEAEGARTRLEASLDVATSDLEEVKRQAANAVEALAAEQAQQQERFASLNQELNEAHLANSRLEAERREADRKATDAERRLQAAERAREKAEGAANERAQEASRAAKDARAASERATTLEAELSGLKDKLEKDVRRLKRLESRLRADAQTYRSRSADALTALQGAVSLLSSLPKEPPTEDEAEEPGKP